MTRIRHAPVLAALLGIWAVVPACSDDEEPAEGGATADAGPSTEDAAAPDAAALDAAAPDVTTALSQAEVAFLIYTREEEKLARDVYLALEGTYPAFTNIARSEQNHMDAVLVLLERYGIPDPAAGKARGAFAEPTLQALHDELVARGSQSTLEAVKVGLTIEELDIRDLAASLPQMLRPDVQAVIENLLRGSRNHLRAFYQALVNLGGTYTPQYLDPTTFQQIATSPVETGGPPGF